jgi:hypothetical protein
MRDGRGREKPNASVNVDRLIRAIQEELGVNVHGNAGLETSGKAVYV